VTGYQEVEEVLKDPRCIPFGKWMIAGEIPDEWNPLIEMQKCMYVTGYQEVEEVLKDPRCIPFGKWMIAGEIPDEWNPLIEMQKRWMLMRGGAEHMRLRTPVMKAFTPQVIERLRPHIEEIANELLDALKGQEQIDIIRDFAYPLPCIAIAELIGVPAEDRDLFKELSMALIWTFEPIATEEQMAEGMKAVQQLREYFRVMVQARREELRDDLMSDLLRSEQLDEEEVLASCVLLLMAGHETTVNLIANGLVTLLRHPEQLAKLKEDASLYTSAIEEILRFEPPVQQTMRFTTEAIEVGGQEIPAHTPIYIALAGANRDPRVFENPETFDITRKNANRHLSFSSGAHYCIGANLARVEAQIALRALIERIGEMELMTEQLAWRPSLLFRGLMELPVRGQVK